MGSVSIAISCATPGAAIYYTTDGSNPTFPISGTTQLYTGPITVSTSETIKAIAQATPFLISFTASAAYVISAPSGLPNLPLTSFDAINGSQSTNYASSTWQQAVANFNMVTYMNYIDIMAGTGTTMSQSMQAVKTYAAALGNPMCLTGFYQILNSLGTSDTRTALYNLCVANNWMLLSGGGAFPSGSLVQFAGAAVPNNTANTNGSAISPLSTSGWSNGLDTCDALADYAWNCFINGTGTAVGQSNSTDAANPTADFIFIDNQFQDIQASGQWLYSSTVYTSSLFTSTITPVAPNLQAGYARIIKRLRARAPNLLIVGNCDQDTHTVPTYESSLLGAYDGVWSEQVIGNNPFSTMQIYGPDAFLQRMVAKEQLRSTNARAFNLFSMGEGGPCPGITSWPSTQTPASWSATFTSTANTMAVNSGGLATWTSTYWNALIYGLVFAALRGWFFDATLFTQAPYQNSPALLDEFFKGSAKIYNWCGTRQTPLLTGIKSTDIANGVNLNIGSQGLYYVGCSIGRGYLNPIGNGAQTVPGISGHYLSTAGYGDPSVNTGAAFSGGLPLKDGQALWVLP